MLLVGILKNRKLAGADEMIAELVKEWSCWGCQGCWKYLRKHGVRGMYWEIRGDSG